jgi:hypothetical protein
MTNNWSFVPEKNICSDPFLGFKTINLHLLLNHFIQTILTTMQICVTLKKETVERMFSLYSSRGTCWKAEHRLGRQASLAPKKTVKAIGAVSVPPSPPCDTGKTLSNTFSAHLVLYPLYPLRTTSACYISQHKPIYPFQKEHTKILSFHHQDNVNVKFLNTLLASKVQALLEYSL